MLSEPDEPALFIPHKLGEDVAIPNVVATYTESGLNLIMATKLGGIYRQLVDFDNIGSEDTTTDCIYKMPGENLTKAKLNPSRDRLLLLAKEINPQVSLRVDSLMT